MHLSSLTSLRFFAALFVVLLHLGAVLGPTVGDVGVFSLGYLGVTFFFILSGFVLTWTFREGDSARPFYGRRFARVWPLHALTTVAAALIILVEGERLNLGAAPFVITLTQAFVPASDVYYSYNAVSWSLSCEAFFYAVFPLLIVFVRKVRRPILFAASTWVAAAVLTVLVFQLAGPLSSVTGISENGLIGYVLNIFPGFRLGEFAIGIALALAVQRGWRCPISLNGSLVLTIVAVAGLTWLQVITEYAQPAIPSVAFIPVAAVLISASAGHDVDGRVSWLQAPFLIRLGQASFALYLVHYWTVAEFKEHYFGPAWLAGLLAVLVSIALAEIAYRLVERPVEKALRRRIGQRQPALP